MSNLLKYFEDVAEENDIELPFAANRMHDELIGYSIVLHEKISKDADCIENLAKDFDVLALINKIEEKDSLKEMLKAFRDLERFDTVQVYEKYKVVIPYLGSSKVSKADLTPEMKFII